MKWCIPAFGISLIVFLVLFAGIEAKQLREEVRHEEERRDEERARSSLLGTEDSAPENLDTREVSLGASRSAEEVDRSTVARVERVSPPPPPLGPPDPAFEAALEEGLARLRPTLISGRSFSRASPSPQQVFDLVRIELRPEDRGVLGASFLIAKKGVARETWGTESLRPWRLDLRPGADGALAYRAASGDWGPLPTLLRGASSWVRGLPVAEASPPSRYRYRGEHFRTMTAEMVRVPLEQRSKHLGEMSLFGRSITDMSTFNITFWDESAPDDPEADFLCQLTADIGIEGMEIREKVHQVPMRYDVSRGEFEIKAGDSWRDFASWANHIRPHAEMVSGQPLENSDTFMIVIDWRSDR